MLLHDVIDAPLASRPNEPAVVSGDDGATLQYGELSRRADAFARRLLDLGLGSGDRVALIARKSPDVVAAFLGASRAGIVYVPLDPQAMASYWAMVLEDLKIRDVLSNIDGVGDKLDGFRVHDLAPGDARDASTGAGGASEVSCFARPARPARPARASRSGDDDAYILATSGSTGRPKGVLLSHRNALSFVDWAIDEVALGVGDRVLSVAPFHFDLSVFDIYASLRCGARLVLAPSMALMFPGQLIAAIDEHNISVLYTVPTVLRMLVDADAFADGAGNSLRAIIYAGEAYPVAELVKLMRALPDVTFYNFFGPTETNVCLAHRFDGVPDPAKDVPIGRPASGACVSLVDKAGDDVAAGDIGEIMIDGPTVMQGYVKADGFHVAEPPFATGDYARLGDDGAYYFRGRGDQQVKVRGARVELASVERALLRVDGVTSAVALVVGLDLVGFIAGEGNFDLGQVRKACANYLPSGAVPHRIIGMACLPRLSNGKLDLAGLKALASEDR